MVSYPLHIYNTTFHPICKVFYYINSVVSWYHIFAPIAYPLSIALVMLVYRVGICYHISMGVKTKEREVRIEYMRLDEIQRDEGNPKLHDLGALAESFERFDFVSPLGVNEKTGKLLWGHGRLDGLIAFMDEGKPVLDGIKVDDDGMWKVPIVRGVHFNSKKGTAYVITDNRQVELGGVDEPKLVETLIRVAGKDGRGLRGTGYDGDDVDTLIRLYRPDLIDIPEDPGPQINKAEALQEKWGTELGQIWEMGDHRLAVGDCTDKAVVDAVMRGEKAVLCNADPPYGMGKESEGIVNDNLYREKLDAFQMAWWRSCRPSLEDNASVYIWGNAEDLWRLWHIGGLRGSERLTLRNEIVWDKAVEGENPTMLITGIPLENRRMYQPTERCLFFMLGEQGFNINADNYWEGWEPIRAYLDGERARMGWSNKEIAEWYGFHPRMVEHWMGKSQWSFIRREQYELLQSKAQGDAFKRDYDELKQEFDELKQEFYATRTYFDNTHDNMTDVWRFERVKGEERFGHATPKPVEMMERIIKSSSPRGAIILAPFAGTWPEGVACERLGRRCRAIEIDPKYCAVTLERMSGMGLEPRLMTP